MQGDTVSNARFDSPAGCETAHRYLGRSFGGSGRRPGTPQSLLFRSRATVQTFAVHLVFLALFGTVRADEDTQDCPDERVRMTELQKQYQELADQRKQQTGIPLALPWRRKVSAISCKDLPDHYDNLYNHHSKLYDQVLQYRREQEKKTEADAERRNQRARSDAKERLAAKNRREQQERKRFLELRDRAANDLNKLESFLTAEDDKNLTPQQRLDASLKHLEALRSFVNSSFKTLPERLDVDHQEIPLLPLQYRAKEPGRERRQGGVECRCP